LVAWLGSRGRLVRVGVEGTGSYGAGLARYLTAAGIDVVEVNRPNRQLRRQRGGKSDSVDAEAAARAAASGQATTVPKSGAGPVECIRMLLVARRSATKARTQAANQIHSLTITAPEDIKDQISGLKLKARVRVCARWRPGPEQTTAAYAKMALRHLARRYQSLDTEIAQLDIEIRRLSAKANPALLAAKGVGPDTAATLLVAAGDNPGRMRSERSFAALCGASPVQASSGRTVRHRLNRGGNRQANNALWRIATTRIRHDAATKDYVARRKAEGKNRKEIIRCLKRHIAREIYRLLTNPPPTPNCARLRRRRQHAGVTLTHVAQAIGTHPSRISALERGRDHNHQLANQYQTWLRTREAAPQPT
jgi:transposase